MQNAAYNEDEITVLNHFFTSICEDVYAVRDAMPMSLWGFLAGLSSRTHVSVRDRFLNIFREDTSKDYATTIHDMAEAIRNSSLNLEKALQRATAFMDKYANFYGHNSLKDSCVDRIVVDRCSIRAAKILEESQLGAYQEKSTRYISFEGAREIIPTVIAEFPEAPWPLLRDSEKLYVDILEAATQYYLGKLDISEFANEAAMLRTAKAKAFDTARYVLLTCKPTALAFTMPSRETERLLAALLTDEHEEVFAIATNALKHARIVNPGLLTHVSPNHYTNQRLDYEHLIRRIEALEPSQSTVWFARNVGFNSTQPNAWLGNTTTDMLVMIAAGVVSASKPTLLPFSSVVRYLQTQENSTEACLQIIERRLAARGKHDPLPKEFALGQMVFNVVMDYGAYRDLQRHRVGTQFCSRLDSIYGYHVPELLYEPEFKKLAEDYRNFMLRLDTYHTKLRESGIDYEAEYMFALGQNVNFTYICDFKQLVYVAELRTTPQAHASYRSVVLALWESFVASLGLTDEHAARFRALFRVGSQDGDRRSQENTQELKNQGG